MNETITPNFGTILSLWDNLFGTLNVHGPGEMIDVGTPFIGKRDLTFGNLLLHLFWRCVTALPCGFAASEMLQACPEPRNC